MITSVEALNEWFIEELAKHNNRIMAQVLDEWDNGEHPRCHFHQFINRRFVGLWLEWVSRN